MLAILFLMQSLNGLQGIAQVSQVLLHHHRTDTQPGRGMADEAGNFGTVTMQEVSLLRRQRVEGCVDLLGGLHQLCFLISTGSVVRITEHNQ